MAVDSINEKWAVSDPRTIKGENTNELNARLREGKPKQINPSDGGISIDASRKPDQEVLPQVEHISHEEWMKRIMAKGG